MVFSTEIRQSTHGVKVAEAIIFTELSSCPSKMAAKM